MSGRHRNSFAQNVLAAYCLPFLLGKMQRSILITQCLQNDFVQPLERYESMPNQLHVGYGEALRLMGERAEDGPVHLALRWAYEQPNDRLAIVHIRDR